MSFKPSQLMIAGLAGLATAIGVALATIQSQSGDTGSERSPSSTQSSPTPAEARSPKPAASRRVPAAPASIPSSPATKPAPASPTPQASASPTGQASPSGVKPEPIVVTPPESGCKISMAVITDRNPPLNVRSSPKVADGNIVGQLKNDTFVIVADEQNGWLRITDPVAGWIAKNRTKSSCPLVKQRINFLPGGNEAIVKGRIVGGGSHTYLIKANKGQTLTVRNHQQVFPLILTPEGKLLGIDPNAAGPKNEWTGQVPANGDYTLQLDSNYKGFDYEFSVQVK